VSGRHVSGSPIKRQTEVKNTLPIGRIEGSKTPIETHTPLIRYFINDIGPDRTWSIIERCRGGRSLLLALARSSHTYVARSTAD
jgi:hypothetical protein